MSTQKRSIDAVLGTDIQTHDPHVNKRLKSPLELCSRNFPKPMYQLMIHLCYMCQKLSTERDCFEAGISGKTYFNIQMCVMCMDYNQAMQAAGKKVLEQYIKDRETDKRIEEKRNIDPLFYGIV